MHPHLAAAVQQGQQAHARGDLLSAAGQPRQRRLDQPAARHDGSPPGSGYYIYFIKSGRSGEGTAAGNFAEFAAQCACYDPSAHRYVRSPCPAGRHSQISRCRRSPRASSRSDTTSGKLPDRADRLDAKPVPCAQRTRLARQPRVEFPSEIRTRGFKDLIRPPELTHLTLQLRDPLVIRGCGAGPLAAVDFRLPQPAPQRLGWTSS